MKHATINLPYFRQGDDLDYFLCQVLTIEEAIEAHALTLDAAAKQLRDIKAAITNVPNVEIEADCHHISIYGPNHLIYGLIEQDLATPDEPEEDDDDYEEDEEDEEEDSMKTHKMNHNIFAISQPTVIEGEIRQPGWYFWDEEGLLGGGPYFTSRDAEIAANNCIDYLN